MSVIVKGMKIPENCWECVKTDLNIAISVFGGMCPYCEKIRTDHDMQTGRHPACPLVALPDHHGRLVDADESEKYFWEHLDDNGMAGAMNAINDMPTIEPERKKGHWIRHPEQRNIFNSKTIECSECHEKYTVQYVEDEWFCRHCGADMREPEDIPMEYFESGGR